MTTSTEVARQFMQALAANDPHQYEAVLAEDVGLRLGRWDRSEAYRPRHRVLKRLMDEWSAWPDAVLETQHVAADGDQAFVQFRIQATEQGRYVEHNRAAALTLKDGRVQTIDLYCPEPIPSAHRQGWIAPATLSAEELERLLDERDFSFDIFEWLPPNANGRTSLRGGFGGSGDAHPASNGVDGIRWTEAEADARIEAQLAYFREQNIGFHWIVSKYDTPPDLGERLERHGLMFAGDAATMARLGLDDVNDIPLNPEAEVTVVDGSRDEDIEAILQVASVCFNMPPAQVAEWRPGMYERLKNPAFREFEITYLARLKGQPAGTGRVTLRCGVAHLTGGSTLPALRSQHIYSTLLRRRLEDAHLRGYQVATVDAEPMSRRVLSRYGFKEYARKHLYGWMPVMDPAVIRSLVPQD